MSEFVLPDELMPPPIGFKLPLPPQEFRGVRLAAFRERGDMIHILPAIFPMIFAYALSTSVEVTAHWFKQSHKEKDIENERLHTELLFLKSQINPHFLFNTLNNIYSLAVDKSDDTETAILMLSQMMRYMLYETNALKVDLNSEIDYLKNYLSLQKLRLSRQKNIKLSIEIKGNPERMNIAPLLLIPLVENAFKHGLSYQQSSRIEVSLECRENLLFFRVQNSKPVENADLRLYENSGIGLKNIKRRLDLLYPNAYKLFIEDNSEQYLVELNLELT
ncbi:MAG: histidine kinase [Microscillaceae bacterium]|nr:histidine kinase [Microscillaceae bacterium]